MGAGVFCEDKFCSCEAHAGSDESHLCHLHRISSPFDFPIEPIFKDDGHGKGCGELPVGLGVDGACSDEANGDEVFYIRGEEGIDEFIGEGESEREKLDQKIARA